MKQSRRQFSWIGFGGLLGVSLASCGDDEDDKEMAMAMAMATTSR